IGYWISCYWAFGYWAFGYWAFGYWAFGYWAFGYWAFGDWGNWLSHVDRLVSGQALLVGCHNDGYCLGRV
ncbi:MAG: hypothetical protein ABGX16_11815, partial [Pirellulales bacterium]